MKRILTMFISLILLTGCLGLTACKEHQHEFDKRSIKSEYLLSQADCINATTYYYSCACGEKGDETFTHGLKLDHSFGDDTICDTCGNSYSSNLEFSLINEDTEYQVNGCPLKFDERLIIPAIYNEKPVTKIKSNAFTLSSFHIVDIPSSIEIIGENAFNEKKALTRVDFCQGSRLKVIEYRAFFDCYHLESICFPNSLKTIEKYAFSNCIDLKSITFEENSEIESIGDFAFSSLHALESIELPGSIKMLSSNVFSTCSILSEIKFNGTMEQWLSFDMNHWVSYAPGMTTVPVKVIQCADGKIYLKK